VVDESELIIWY